MPLTGASVGDGVGGMGVSVGGGMGVGGNVAVMMNGVAVPLDGTEIFNPQAESNSVNAMVTKKYLRTRQL